MMASNNYYGFTHGGTLSNVVGAGYVTSPGAPTSAYPQQVSTGYTAAHRGYDQTYATSALPTQYAYASRSQPAAGSVAYAHDTSQYGAGNSVVYPYTNANTGTYTNTYNSVVTNYAASALYNQHATVSPQSAAATAPVYTSGKTSNWNFAKKPMKGTRPKTTTKVQQLHYCEVCKISCAGPQTYKEHLDGQRHKKKEAQAKSGTTNNSVTHKRGLHLAGIALRCELCDVTCTGNDAYAAHIRGSKHQKVVKLHTKLGKPIPSVDPVVINQKGVKTTTIPQIPVAAGKIKVLGTPRINFTGGGRLHTTSGVSEPKEDPKPEETIVSQPSIQQLPNIDTIELDKSDALPVGQDYVEEVKSEGDKIVSFHCKLCDCRFNDPNAKEMHLKGRRHRLAYKKKVDPNLIVDLKPSLKHRKVDVKDRRHFHNKRDHYWNDWYSPPANRYEQRHPMLPPMPPPMPPPPGFGGLIGSPMSHSYNRRGPGYTSWDDTHIIQKHSEIIPKEDELDEIYHVVMICEKALKLVSDKLAEEDNAAAMNETIKKELGDETGLTVISENASKDDSSLNSENDTEKNEEASSNRILKGLMRVGILAKSLILSGDKEVDLVVMCSEKPTKTLLQRVVEHLPQLLQAISSSESFQIVMKPQDAGLCVISTTDPKISVNVTLTSPLVRDANLPEGTPQPEMVKEPKQMLERQKCLEALAALRHAKWYQARVANLHPCPMIIRLLRDLCRRLPTWSKLSLWAVELLCERVVVSAGEQITPGEALRHTFEAIASGLLLQDDPGLLDPCEKEPTDALTHLSSQDREDITSSAQHALRLIAFRQIYKILGVDPVPQRMRKRRRDSDADDVMEQDVGSGKKDKKDQSDFAEDESILSSGDNIQQFSDESGPSALPDSQE